MEHVQNQFDDLNVQALSLADGALSQIAETASCTGAQTCRILQKTLEKAGIPQTVRLPEPEPKKPVLRKKRKLRLITAAAAAVITVTAVTLGVSGRLTYNKPLVEKSFGMLGAARLEEMDLPEPVTYTNGLVNATVEAAICDGNNVLVLMTMKAVDPETKIDWKKELNFLHEKGYPINGFGHAFTKMIGSSEIENEYWLTMEFEINKDLPADSFVLAIGAQQELEIPDEEMIRKYGNSPDFSDLYEDPSLIGETDPVRNRYTGGLEIEIPLTVNTPVYEMTSEDGGTVFLSGFELFTEKWQPFCDVFNSDRSFTLHKQDGSTSELHYLGVSAQGGNTGSNHKKKYQAEAKIYEAIAGRHFQCDDPTSFNGFVDITGVTSMELAGVTYYRTDS